MYKVSGYTRNQQDRVLLFERQLSAKRKLDELKKEEEEKNKENVTVQEEINPIPDSVS